MRKRILIIFTLSGLIGVVLYTLPVKNVECRSQYGECNAKIQERLKSVTGHRLLSAKRELVKYLADEKLVNDYSVRLILPNSLDIVIVENKADVAVIRQGESIYSLMSTTGEVLSSAESSQLPKIFIRSGTPTDEELTFAAIILDELFVWNDIALAVVDEDKLELESGSGMLFILPLSGDVDIILGSYRLLLSWLNSETGATRIEEEHGFRPKIVDLRFKNPILR